MTLTATSWPTATKGEVAGANDKKALMEPPVVGELPGNLDELDEEDGPDGLSLDLDEIEEISF